MMDIACTLDEINNLHDEVMDALMNSDALRVEQLVAKQSECLANVSKNDVRAEHKARLEDIARKVQMQQMLIEQASNVAGQFLHRFYQDGSFTQRG